MDEGVEASLWRKVQLFVDARRGEDLQNAEHAHGRGTSQTFMTITLEKMSWK